MFTFELAANSPKSISSNPPSIEHEWIAEGVDDHATVHEAALLYTPPAVATAQGTLYRQDVKLSKEGHNLFYVTVPYGPRDKAKWTWSFGASGSTQNIRCSLAHVASYVAEGEEIEDQRGAINRQIDGTVTGADIIVPTMRFTVTATHPAGVVTPQYAKKIFNLIGKVNSTPFMTFQAGEVLCVSGDASDGTECEATVSLSFLLEPNRSNFWVGQVNVEQKDGHDFAWVRFVPKDDPVENVAYTKGVQVDVCRVYERVDIAGILGIG